MKRLLLLTALMAVPAWSACARVHSSEPERCTPSDAGSPVDPTLLAFLSRARAAHHLADDFESAGDVSAAAVPLSALVAGPFPRSGEAGVRKPTTDADLPPEVREVLADTFARLADFHSRSGAYQQALSEVQSGLQKAGGPNYFQGHLLETEGLIEERRAKSLETSDRAGAAAARQHAIELLESAMKIQSGVISHDTGAPADAGK